jgi:hypothetical protein
MNADHMIVRHEREKLIHAILYFIQNTKHCHTLKLFKLLSFLDFEHYRQTGRSVTGLIYKALPKGPVPTALYGELERPSPDFAGALSIIKRHDEATNEFQRRDIRPKGVAFNPKLFSKRELQIMSIVAEMFRDLTATDMTHYSHDPNLPWRKVFAKGKGQGKPIPYDLALGSDALLKDEATIDAEELAYKAEALKELRSSRG